MPHFHLVNGKNTGAAIPDPKRPGSHFHVVDDEKTSSEKYSETHRHRWWSLMSSEAIEHIQTKQNRGGDD